MKLVTKVLIIALSFYCAAGFSASDAITNDNIKGATVASNTPLTSTSYTAQYREASRLLAAIKPLYPEQLLFSLIGDQIFIRGDAETISQASKLLEEMDQPERYFRLLISQTKPQNNVKSYSTQSSAVTGKQSFAIVDNKPLLISKRSESQRLSAAGPLWYQTETKVSNEQTIEFNVRALTASRAELSYRIKQVNQSNQQVQRNTMVVTFNEWVALSGEGSGSERSANTKVYSSNQVNRLFIKLETY